MEFAGRTVIVTGGASGIGEACARRFAEEGAFVAIADRDAERAARLSADIAAALGPSPEGGPRAIAIGADVSRGDDAERIVGTALEATGRIDALFNNAAVILPKPLEDITGEEFDRVVSVNLKGAFWMTKHAIPHLRRARGTIVNMASLNGLVGQKLNPVYAATKGGIVAMTKSLALDYAGDGVRVNCVCPAGVMTPLLADWADRQPDPARAREELNAMHPIGRPATTGEIAEAVLYLAGGRSGFLTGVALPVDGGASLGY